MGVQVAQERSCQRYKAWIASGNGEDINMIGATSANCSPDMSKSCPGRRERDVQHKDG